MLSIFIIQIKCDIQYILCVCVKLGVTITKLAPVKLLFSFYPSTMRWSECVGWISFMRFAFAVPLVLATLLLEVAPGKQSHTLTKLFEGHLTITVFVYFLQGFSDVFLVYFILWYSWGEEGWFRKGKYMCFLYHLLSGQLFKCLCYFKGYSQLPQLHPICATVHIFANNHLMKP